jgi:hypothetical protein
MPTRPQKYRGRIFTKDDEMNSTLQNLKDNPLFWEGAFLLALLLLIGSHKIALEGMISA